MGDRHQLPRLQCHISGACEKGLCNRYEGRLHGQSLLFLSSGFSDSWENGNILVRLGGEGGRFKIKMLDEDGLEIMSKHNAEQGSQKAGCVCA